VLRLSAAYLTLCPAAAGQTRSHERPRVITPTSKVSRTPCWLKSVIQLLVVLLTTARACARHLSHFVANKDRIMNLLLHLS
jgi:hypothetical protein